VFGFGSSLRINATNSSCFPIIEGTPSVHTLTKLLNLGLLYRMFLQTNLKR